jgi:hypothetical protein
MVKIKTKAVEFSIPGWVKVSLEPNDTELTLRAIC